MYTVLTPQLRLAIQKNNQAVLQITAGVFSEAIENLTFALNVYRQNMEETSWLETECHRTSLDQYMTFSEAIQFRESEEEDDCYVYRQGIHIPLDVSCHYHSSVLVSTMIIFNLALVQQLEESDPKKSKSKLVKAARLYDLAFNMQQVQQLGDNVYFTLATVNNLAVIYQQLGDLEAAGKCFEHLLSSLMLVLDCGKSSPHFGHFAYNATSFMSKVVIAPAA